MVNCLLIWSSNELLTLKKISYTRAIFDLSEPEPAEEYTEQSEVESTEV